MKGLELARNYYLTYGKPTLAEQFPEYADRIACGIAGEGSDCLGFDDKYSQDHDFGPGFCLWLTDADANVIGPSLRECYASLPKEFMGYQKRSPLSYGEQRLSAMRISDFYRKFTGQPNGPNTLEQWRMIPEHFLSAATSGEIFEDKLGAFSQIRNRLLAFYPEDIRRKKLAARCAIMAQAGQYNYARCLTRGENVAATMALAQFIEATCSAVYLLNKKYMPFYKWAHHGIRHLKIASDIYGLLVALCENMSICNEMSMGAAMNICDANNNMADNNIARNNTDVGNANSNMKRNDIGMSNTNNNTDANNNMTSNNMSTGDVNNNMADNNITRNNTDVGNTNCNMKRNNTDVGNTNCNMKRNDIGMSNTNNNTDANNNIKRSNMNNHTTGWINNAQIANNTALIEDICAIIIQALNNQNLTDSTSDFLLDHGTSIQSQIVDEQIRNMHIMSE
ncbi:MAG: DUF4037 domain-containing protein [Clostridiales Family XIII bacterium]|jgi:hypothetical protein|nr:DUF4037 domain-containing protein [Clostridiales Family XIII bacterium]